MRKNLAWVVVSATLLGCLVSCKQIRRVSRTSYIIGENDIEKVDRSNVSKIPVDVLNASVLITTYLQDKKIKFCSGTLIEPVAEGYNPRVLTNHHCFAKTGADGQSTETVYLEACTNTTIYFGFVPGVKAELVTNNCEEGTLRSHHQADVAVFTLSKTPPERFKPLKFWEGETPKNRAAFIVHYPDVEEHLTKLPDFPVRLPAAATTLNNCEVLGTFPVSEWDLDQTLPFSLRHTCDLIHGSSGSGLIDKETSQILGVNWGGIKITYPEGVRTDNVATHSSFILNFLNDNVDTEIQRVNQEKDRARIADTNKNKKSDITKTGASLAEACGVVANGDGNGKGIGIALLALLIAPLFATWLPRRS